MLLAVLRGANEHFHQVVMQAIKELALESPLELGVVDVAGMQLEIVGMDGRIGEARADDDFDRIAFGAGIKLDERVLVETKLLLHARQAIDGHAAIVVDALLVPQGLDWVKTRSFDGRQHAADQADQSKDDGSNHHDGRIDLELDVGRLGILGQSTVERNAACKD